MEAKRIAWIDNAKAIGIFLVVLGHLPVPEYLATYIYSFHMPLFFFLSGLVFKGRESTVLAFARARSRTLLIPYIVFGVVTYLFWVLITRNVGQDIGTGIPWYQPLIGMLYSNGIDDWLIHNVPIWFLTCLLLTELCFYLLSRVANGYLQLLAALATVATLGYCASYFNLPRFPWGLNLITETLVFFGAGYLVGSGFRDGHLSIRSGALLVLAMLGVHLVLAFWNGRVDMNWNNQGNFLLFYLAAFSGIGGWLLMARMMPASRIVAYVGQNTLTILLLHGMAFSVLKGVLVFALGMPSTVMTGSVALNLMFAAAAVILLLPVAYVFNRYCSLSIGKPAKPVNARREEAIYARST